MRTTRRNYFRNIRTNIYTIYKAEAYIYKYFADFASLQKKTFHCSNAAAAVRTHARTHSTQNNVLNTNSIPSNAYRPHKYSSMLPALPATHAHKYRDSFAFVNRNKHILNNTTNVSVLSSSSTEVLFRTLRVCMEKICFQSSTAPRRRTYAD